MRKIIALLLAALLITSGMTFVYADTITASLIYVDDFESYDVGTYGRYQSDIGSIRDIGGMYAPGGISEGCTFEIVQEEGNKFLKVTVPDYTAFGVWFGGSTKYAYMTCDYKFPTAEGNTGFSICGNIWGTTYLNNVEGWPGTNPSTNTTATEWTQWNLTENKRLLDQTKYIAIGHGQDVGNKVIYIDNIVVWEFNDAAGNTHNSSVSSTVTFANSTGYTGDITMPSAFSGIAWCNLYGAQGSNCTINLNNYTPTGAPAGKKFAGWSLTDGGNKIKDTMYSAFKIPGNITLYAVWEDVEVITKKEDFEGFSVNQVITSSDLDFIYLNAFARGTFTATVKAEASGNKYLRIETEQYGGFAVKNRETDDGAEYLKVNCRFPETSGSRFELFSGTGYSGGSNQIGAWTRTTSWRNHTIASDPSKTWFGGFFDQDSGNYVIELDDLYYWFVPTGETKTVTTTFANSTVNAPAAPTFTASLSKSIWQTSSTASNSIYLPDYPATDPSGGYIFAGWSRTDNGQVINPYEETYTCVCDETLYAVWVSKTGPTTSNEVAIGSQYYGIRFKAYVTEAQREYADEYGFIATRIENLDGGSKELTFDLTVADRNKKPFVKGVAFKRTNGIDNVWEVNGDNVYFTILLTGITAERKGDTYVARPYLKTGEFILYGDCVQSSMDELE